MKRKSPPGLENIALLIAFLLLLISLLSGCSRDYLITQVHKEGEMLRRYDLKDIKNTREYYIYYHESYYEMGDTLTLRKKWLRLKPMIEHKGFEVKSF